MDKEIAVVLCRFALEPDARENLADSPEHVLKIVAWETWPTSFIFQTV